MVSLFHLCLFEVGCLVQINKTCTKHSGRDMLHIDDEGERPHNHFYSYVKKEEEMVWGTYVQGRMWVKEVDVMEQNLKNASRK